MAFKPRHLLRSQLLVTVHAGAGNPVAFRLNVKKVSVLALFLSCLLLVSVLGALLFFRELEINRKLADRVLEFEVRQNLATINSTPQAVSPIVAAAAAAVTPSAMPIRVLDSVAPQAAAIKENTSTTGENTGVGRARLAELNADCVAEHCTAKVALVPSAPGMAQGQVLVILETEIPRIGTANANVNIRKRYFVYPGYSTHDDLNPDEIGKLEGKTFKFSRALQATADFTVGHLLRPLAINFYLYDQAHTLVQHERKVIDTDDEYDH